MQVANRIAVVTGSGQGIGAGIARRLALAGAKVVLNDIAPDKIEQVQKELDAEGALGFPVVADVSTKDGADSLIAATVERFGRVDILVNNVGIARDKWISKMTDDDWDSVMTVNLKSQFLTCRAVVPHMREQSHGRIVNISSRAWLGGAGQANYSASKGGVVSLSRTLALELAKFGITVNCVAPALVDTPLFQALGDETKDRLAGTVPMGRVGTPADIAEAVSFFASDEASYITGQLIYVCGGRSIGAS
jgi:NAD(P)-dependent dehydrogenase (short-subunit alcohol dehydrogenase family)